MFPMTNKTWKLRHAFKDKPIFKNVESCTNPATNKFKKGLQSQYI